MPLMFCHCLLCSIIAAIVTVWYDIWEGLKEETDQAIPKGIAFYAADRASAEALV